MSSSNEIDIVYVPESVYGETPSGVDFETVRKTSDSLSGTPEISVSPEARKDRQSGGQTLVGMDVGGGIGYVLSASKCFDDFLEAGMMNDWIAEDGETGITLTLNAVAGTLTRGSGDFTTKVSAGQWIELANFVDAVNNVPVFVTNVTALALTFEGPATMVTAATEPADYKVPQHTKIGTTRKSFSVEKQFTDIGKFISYTGMRVAGFTMETKTGDPVMGEFTFGGADYDTPATSIAAAETTNSAGSAQIINSTVDMGVLLVDNAVVPYCVEGSKVELNNNLSAQKCIGQVGPKDQIPFEAAVNIDLTAHLTADSFALLADKIAQTPISISLSLRDGDGVGYALYIPRIQLSFPDPAMSGKNTHVMINASGVASYDATADNTLFLYRLGL